MNALKTTFELGKIKLRNRLVLPPITTNYAAPDGTVTTDILSFYDKRSANVGLTIVEACAVNAAGRIVPNSLGLWSDRQISGLKDLVRVIHSQGAAAVIQLNHAGPRCFPDNSLKQGFSPSGIAFRPDVDPYTMDKHDIIKLADDFTNAAVRACDAGFDGVEIHGAHLYLLSQFISPATNKRDDEYGGDIAGRVKTAVDIVANVKENIPSNATVFFRINAEERIEGGLTANESVTAAKLLKKAGVDIFDVSLIAYGGFKEVEGKIVLVGSSALPKDKPPGDNVELTAAFKKHVGTPVIGVGKFGAGPEANTAVEHQGIDLVAVGRQMICDPESAGKMLDLRQDDIIGCDECLACFASIGKGSPLACKKNKTLPS
jgi:2,4-dienoyl-CoA reductase-like NADH-dependent reductase (Old Yellow Enzyme family)